MVGNARADNPDWPQPSHHPRKQIRKRPQAIGLKMIFLVYRRLNIDEKVEGGSGFLTGSSATTRSGALRLRDVGLAVTGLAAAVGAMVPVGSSAFIARR